MMAVIQSAVRVERALAANPAPETAGEPSPETEARRTVRWSILVMRIHLIYKTSNPS